MGFGWWRNGTNKQAGWSRDGPSWSLTLIWWQARALAEIDFEIGEKDAELAKIDKEIQSLRGK